MSSKNIVVISPHPDDLEIGMGGTASKLVENGHSVVSVVVTDGRGSTKPDNVSEDEQATIRKSEVLVSSEILGIKEIECFDLADVKSDNNKIMLENMLSDCFNKYNPSEIYIPHPEIDKHPTHKIVADVAVKSVSTFSKETDIWCYEVWTPFPEYDRIEDITEFVEIKTKAIKAHESQLSYKDYISGVLGLNKYRAVFNDVYESVEDSYAEVFIKFDNNNKPTLVYNPFF